MTPMDYVKMNWGHSSARALTDIPGTKKMKNAKVRLKKRHKMLLLSWYNVDPA